MGAEDSGTSLLATRNVFALMSKSGGRSHGLISGLNAVASCIKGRVEPYALSVEEYSTGVWGVCTGACLDEGRLAGPVDAHDCQDLTLVDLEVCAGQAATTP